MGSGRGFGLVVMTSCVAMEVQLCFYIPLRLGTAIGCGIQSRLKLWLLVEVMEVQHLDLTR